jgi:ELWxxDGT repeat protein
LIFTADRGASGTELWGSDGSAAGTTPIGRLNPGGEGKLFAPNWLEAVGHTVYFDGTQEASGRELWALALAGPQLGDPGSGGVKGLA